MLRGRGDNIDIQRQTTTDADGKFTFNNVPPEANCRVYENVPTDARSARFVTIGSAKVDAGQTMTASFGGVGRPVIGTIALPPGLPADAEVWIATSPGGAMSALRSLLGKPAPEVDFVVFADHTFRANDVLPGTYHLDIRVHTAFTPQHPEQRELAEGTAELVVPAVPLCPTDVPVNLGRIATHPIAQ
jgi:hypothetical protein